MPRELCLLLLPPALGGWFLFLERKTGSRENAWRLLVGGVAIVVLTGTELLSSLHLLLPSVSLALFVLLAGAGLALLLRARPSVPSFRLGWLALPALLVLAGVFLSGLLCVPNNMDAMTYHLARVVQWASRNSVAPYPTHLTIQLSHPPWAEFALLQLFLVLQGFRWLFLVQFAAWLACAVELCLLARVLGFDRVVAVLLLFALPTAVLEASTAQNDLVVAFWALHFFSSLLLLEGKGSRWRVADTGVSLAAFLATKGTAYVFTPAILVGWFLFRRPLGARVLGGLGAALAFAAMLNAPYYLRGYSVFGHPLPGGGEVFHVESLAPLGIAGNFLKNSALHLNAPVEAWSRGIDAAIQSWHRFAGIRAEDPAFTSAETGYFFPPLFFYEDYDGNTLCFLLVLAATLWWLWKSFSGAGLFLGTFWAGFALESFLKWKPWNARLHLPLFVVALPALAIFLESVFGKSRARGVGALLCLAALPYAYLNSMKPLVALGARKAVYTLSPDEQMFAGAPAQFPGFEKKIEELRRSGCRVIGLTADRYTFELPLWMALGYPGSPLAVRHWGVRNESARVEDSLSALVPCAFVDLREGR